MVNYTLRIIRKGSDKKIQTHKKRRFYRQLASLKETTATFYLRVFYGRYRDVFGTISEFYNDGYYNSKRGLIKALEGFDELAADKPSS